MKKIGYKIIKSYEEETYDNSNICIDVEINHTYTDYEKAKKEVQRYKAVLELIAGEWKIIVYKDETKEMTIEWTEWYKYRCSKLKDSSKGVTFLDEYKDYEPCSIKFDEFAKIMKRRSDLDKIPLRNIGYAIKPTFV